MNRSALRFVFVVAVCALVAIGKSVTGAPRCYVVGRFQIAAGTVFDGATGLTWQQAVAPQSLSWTDAATYCSAQGGGFRLPTLKELQSIIDYTKAPPGPTINPIAFPNTPGGAYWTSSAFPGSPIVSAWEVFFDFGSTTTVGITVLDHVRCVR